MDLLNNHRVISNTIIPDFLLQEWPYSKLHAWIDLLLLSTTQKEKRLFRGHIYELYEGELIFSDNTLGQKWGWSRQKTRKFLDLLEQEKLISIKRDKRKSIITICKPEANNLIATTDNTLEKEAKTTEKGQQKEHIKTQIINTLNKDVAQQQRQMKVQESGKVSSIPKNYELEFPDA